jgi:hypothetical protein
MRSQNLNEAKKKFLCNFLLNHFKNFSSKKNDFCASFRFWLYASKPENSASAACINFQGITVFNISGGKDQKLSQPNKNNSVL